MNLSLEMTLAWRYLRSKYREKFVSIIGLFAFIGIMLGVATLVVVTSVMNGFRHELISRIVGVNGHLGVFAKGGLMEPDQTLRDTLTHVSGVKGAYPFIERQALAMHGAVASGVLVQAFHLEDLFNRPVFKGHTLVAGSWESLQEPNSIVIGVRLAEKLHLQVGDKLKLVSPQGDPSALGMVPRLKGLKVVGIFDVGMHEYNGAFVFTSITTAQQFFRMNNAISGYQIFFEDPQMAPRGRDAITHLLQGRNAYAFDWQQANASFFQALKVERNVMFIILTLIIVVAAFNIISTLVMMVNQKKGEVAILRTLGASRGMITRVFCLSGAMLGVSGTLVGAVVGVVVTKGLEPLRGLLEKATGTKFFPQEIYYLTKLPTQLNITDVVLVVSFAICLSLLATLYPARRAAQMDAAEILRQVG